MGGVQGVWGERGASAGADGVIIVVCDVAVDGVGSGHVVGGLGVAVGVVCDVAELVGA
jgi:hypothetical protein